MTLWLKSASFFSYFQSYFTGVLQEMGHTGFSESTDEDLLQSKYQRIEPGL